MKHLLILTYIRGFVRKYIYQNKHMDSNYLEWVIICDNHFLICDPIAQVWPLRAPSIWLLSFLGLLTALVMFHSSGPKGYPGLYLFFI